jgi:hypothetical protein
LIELNWTTEFNQVDKLWLLSSDLIFEFTLNWDTSDNIKTPIITKIIISQNPILTEVEDNEEWSGSWDTNTWTISTWSLVYEQSDEINTITLTNGNIDTCITNENALTGSTLQADISCKTIYRLTQLWNTKKEVDIMTISYYKWNSQSMKLKHKERNEIVAEFHAVVLWLKTNSIQWEFSKLLKDKQAEYSIENTAFAINSKEWNTQTKETIWNIRERLAQQKKKSI